MARDPWEILVAAIIAIGTESAKAERRQLAAWRETQEILRRAMKPAEYADLMNELWGPDPIPSRGMAFDAFPQRKEGILFSKVRSLWDQGQLSKQYTDQLVALFHEIDEQFGGDTGTELPSAEQFFRGKRRQARQAVQQHIDKMPDNAVATQNGIAAALRNKVGIGRDALLPIIREMTGGHLKQRHTLTFGELRRRLLAKT